MAVADLAAEWFENETLRALVGARGIFGAFAGPWSAGTSAPLLLQAAQSGNPIAPATLVKGGMGALTDAIAKAATEAGAEIQTDADIAGVLLKDGKAIGVVRRNGEEIFARAVISNADPKTTFLKLVDAGALDPSFLQKIQNYRAHGTVARVNLALSALPNFKGVDETEKLAGRIHIGPDIDYLERAFDAAKYGDFSSRPYMDITIPTLTDSSLAPGGAQVISIHAQFAPYKLNGYARVTRAASSTPEACVPVWDSRREEFGDMIVNTLSDYAPNLKELIVARQVITPLDLESKYGLSGGHINHGEMSLDQLFAFRPLIGWAQYRTPIENLYLCGAGTHPGGGVTGIAGLNASLEIIKDLKRRKT